MHFRMFFAGEKQIGEAGEKPFEFAWSPEEDGQVSLTAVAWEDEDAFTRSDPVV